MNWKNWPSWLKGGMIGGGVGIIIDIILILLNRVFFNIGDQIYSFLMLLGFPWNFIIGFMLIIIFEFGGGAPIYFAVGFGNFIGAIINGFIIGAVRLKLKRGEIISGIVLIIMFILSLQTYASYLIIFVIFIFVLALIIKSLKNKKDKKST